MALGGLVGLGLEAGDGRSRVCVEAGRERPPFTRVAEDARYPEPMPRVWMIGRSVGAPNAGLLLGGARLPRSHLYRCRSAVTCVGSSSTVEALLRAIVRYQRRMGLREPLGIGDISREGGGALYGHKSHQSGRDVDIAIPRRAGDGLSADDVDWRALGLLIEALTEEGSVDAIFLDYEHQGRLVSTSSDPRMRSLVQWRAGTGVEDRQREGLVRHAPGHVGHVHVRFRCGENDDGCLTNPIGDVHVE